MKRSRILLLALSILALVPPAARGAGPIITEFMAVNERTYPDEDGDYPDWIEIYNPGPAAVDLKDWGLSDRIVHPTKWRFPAVTLDPGEFLVVFASEKHRVNPAAPLHANFKLTSEGEFLGLSDPQGNVVSSFAPYPYQFPSISYGLPQPVTRFTLVPEAAAAFALVPASGALGLTWTQVSFNAASWTQGPTGVGYDTGADYGTLIGTDIEGAMRGRNGSAYLRVPFTVADPSGLDALTLWIKYDDGFAAYLNGAEVARRNAPATLAWNSTATAAHGQPISGSMAQDFDAAGAAYVLTQHAAAGAPTVESGGPAGRFLRLLPDNTGSLTNTAGFDQTFVGPTDIITCDFDFRMPVEAGHTGCCGERADGFGFALLSTVEYGASGPGPNVAGIVWERPSFPDAFSVGFDIFDGTGAENTVSMNWNGAEVASVRVAAFQLNNGAFNRCHLEVRRDGFDSLVTLTLTPNVLGTPGAAVAVFTDQVVPAMSPFDGRVAFGGRTGGAFTAVDLDNIRVRFDPASPTVAYEEIDLTAHRGKLLAGQNVLALHGLNRTAADGDFLLLPVLEAEAFGGVQAGTKEYYPVPTPGGPNGQGVPGVSAEPAVSHESGAYAASFSVTLTAGAAGTSVRFTTGGAEPTETSTLYTAPIPITRNTVLKAKGFKAGLLPSRTAERFYVRLDASAANFDSNLPVVVLDTFGAGIGQSAFTPARALFIDTSPDRAAIADPVDWSGYVGLKVRGSSSTGFPKKQFAFETWDSTRDDRDAAILGFPAESDFILYGPYTDKTLMRDALSYEWSNEIGRWAVRGRYVEVYLKTGAAATLGSADYAGVYVFFEKIKRDRNRVDIRNLLASDNAEPAVSGGYILKKDRLDPGDTGFQTNRGQTLAFVDPKEQEITAAQRAYIKSYLDAFETALYGAGFRDPVNGYRKYIDPDSFIDHHLLVELTKNIDGFRLSTFMFKDRGERLQLGPIWDFNLCLGNANYLEGWKPDGWYNTQIGDGDYPWFRRLFQDPDFAQRYIDRWTALRREQFLAENLLADIDLSADLLFEAQARNYARWPIIGTYVWPNWYIGPSYQAEVDWMKGWLEARLVWFDGNYLAPPAFNQEGGVVADGFPLTLTAPVGTIHYTLDGTDPRLPGGGISPAARQHGSASGIALVPPPASPRVRALVPPDGSLGLAWTQTAFNDAAWPSSAAGVGVGYDANPDYLPLVNLNVGAMRNVNGSVYIRIPFSVPDPAALDSMVLRVKYDDGFAAYLNGRKLAERAAPVPLAWNSEATANRDEGQAVTFESINVTGFLSALQTGANVLAIHGLNFGINSSDLLIVPELTASRSTAGAPIPISPPVHVIARAEIGGSWSGRVEASFVSDRPLALRVTEVMFHPKEPPPESIHDSDDFEFIEMANVGASPLSLLGVQFTDGIEWAFSNGRVTALGPGEHVVVVKNLAAFSSRYDTTGLKIAGEYGGNLDNDGEQLAYRDGRGQVVQLFTYDDLWYAVTDGDGYSLHIADPAGDLASWSLKDGWTPSALLDGSPGEGEGGPPPGGFQLPGDANQDGRLDLADALALLLHLFQGAARPLPCGGASPAEGGNLGVLDLNADLQVDISDAIHALVHLYRQGPPPARGSACQRVTGCPEACFP